MSKELEEALERIKEFYPQWRLSNRKDFNLIESTLKNYEELTSKPVILYGRTHGQTQATIDYICKNYKEVKITNLEDENKLKALDIIKGSRVCGLSLEWDINQEMWFVYMSECSLPIMYGYKKEDYDLLREVFKDE